MGYCHVLSRWRDEIIVGSAFDDWVYWHFFTITINYYSSESILTAEASLHSASRSMTAYKQTNKIKFKVKVKVML
jgi:hypothetical protein